MIKGILFRLRRGICVLLALLFASLLFHSAIQAHDGHRLPMPGEAFERKQHQPIETQESSTETSLEKKHEAWFSPAVTLITGASLWASYASPIPPPNVHQAIEDRTSRMYLVGSGLEVSILQGSFWEWSTGGFVSGGVTENTTTSQTENIILGGWIGADIGTTIWLHPHRNWDIRMGIGLTIGAGAEGLGKQIIPHFPVIPFVMLEIAGFGLKVGYVVDTLLAASSRETFYRGESVIVTLSHRFSLAINDSYE